jgi:hypothetical protein
MSWLPEDARFEELVADLFSAYRRSGFALSGLDAELLATWADRGIPFEVVARGIRRAAEKGSFHVAPGEPPFRSLRACRRAIEAEIRKHLLKSAGK